MHDYKGDHVKDMNTLEKYGAELNSKVKVIYIYCNNENARGRHVGQQCDVQSLIILPSLINSCPFIKVLATVVLFNRLTATVK